MNVEPPRASVVAAGDVSFLDSCLSRLYACQCLPEDEVRLLCQKAREIFDLEPNVPQVPLPCTLVGDLHGQFWGIDC